MYRRRWLGMAGALALTGVMGVVAAAEKPKTAKAAAACCCGDLCGCVDDCGEGCCCGSDCSCDPCGDATASKTMAAKVASCCEKDGKAVASCCPATSADCTAADVH
jgi:hypothetical protein